MMPTGRPCCPAHCSQLLLCIAGSLSDRVLQALSFGSVWALPLPPPVLLHRSLVIHCGRHQHSHPHGHSHAYNLDGRLPHCHLLVGSCDPPLLIPWPHFADAFCRHVLQACRKTLQPAILQIARGAARRSSSWCANSETAGDICSFSCSAIARCLKTCRDCTKLNGSERAGKTLLAWK